MAVKYNEVMEHVQLSDEARERILKNVREAQHTPQMTLSGRKEETEAPKGKKILFVKWQRWAAAAAVLFLIAVGAAAVLPRLKENEPKEPAVMSTFQLEKYASGEELGDAMGFPVEDLRNLPVTISEIQYQAIAGEVAQVIVLYGEDGEPGRIVFRKSAGEDDNSGDYNQYDSERTAEMNGNAVTLKGADGTAALALWQRDGFSYSMAFDPEVPEDTAAAYLSEILK